MHISEGIITGLPALGYTAGALGLVGIGARKMTTFVKEHPEKKPLLGMAGAFIFFLSLVPLPAFTGTTSHPCGSPLAGILLGPFIGIALSGLSLLLQAAFFAHGGFSSWGANVVTLGVGVSLGGWVAFKLARKAGCSLWISAGFGGLAGDLMTYAFAGFSLSAIISTGPTAKLSFLGYLGVIYAAYVPTQGPIAIAEMLATGLIVYYIYKQRPEVLESLRVTDPLKTPVNPLIILSPLFILSISLNGKQAYAQESAPPVVVTEGAEEGMPGMDEAVNERHAEEAGLPPSDPLLNTEAWGDLWNTMLLLAGGICGFIIGRGWHLLFKKPGVSN